MFRKGSIHFRTKPNVSILYTNCVLMVSKPFRKTWDYTAVLEGSKICRLEKG